MSRSRLRQAPAGFERLGWLCPGQRFNKELTKSGTEHLGNTPQDDNADIGGTTLHLSEVGRSNVRLRRKLLNRQATLHPHPADVPADKLLCLHLEKPSACQHLIQSLYRL